MGFLGYWKKENLLVEDKVFKPIDIANFFLSKSSLTPKKLQKLVYYAHAWFITLNNDDPQHLENYLLNEDPEAWIHGPVFPSLYQEYKSFAWHEVPKLKKEVKFKNSDIQSFLNDVWGKYGKYSADQLEYMTHQEFPWQNARKTMDEHTSSKQPISKKDIFNYYNGVKQK